MFTIIGGDGKEYGPVTADQVKAWMAAGRANLDTRAKAVGSEEWRRLGDFAEFAPGGTELPPPIAAAPAPGNALDVSGAPVNAGPDPTLPPLELAERGTRLGAAIIDRAIALLCTLPGLVIIGPSFIAIASAASRGEEPSFDEVNAVTFGIGMLVALLGWLAQFIVQVWMLTTRGQSIGKRLLKIRIVLFRDHGHPGFLHAWLLRNFVPGVIGAIPYIGILFTLVDVCFIFGEQRRCIHDHIAGTKVVKA